MTASAPESDPFTPPAANVEQPDPMRLTMFERVSLIVLTLVVAAVVASFVATARR